MIRSGAPAVLCIVLLASCSPDPPEPIRLPAESPELAITALFRFAVEIGPQAVLPDGLVDADLRDEHEPALLDRLEPLAGAGEVRILSVERFPEAGRAVADVEFDLPGEGFALWSVQLEQGEDGGWFVVWIQGPDGSWPPKKKGRGEGLTTSPIPELQ